MAFAVGAVGMWVGALVSALVVKPPTAVAACLLASWTGGSVNFIACGQALQLPPSAIPVTFAADNISMGIALAAMMACPLRLVRRFTAVDREVAPLPPPTARPDAPETPASSPKGSGASSPRKGGARSPPRRPSADGGPGGAAPSAAPPAAADWEGSDGGMVIADIQAALTRQVTVPARMAGKPIAKDGTLLLTEEPAAVAVWAAYQRSRDRAAYGGSGGSGASADGASGTATPNNTDYASSDGDGSSSSGSDSDGSSGSGGRTPVLPPDFGGLPGSSSGDPVGQSALGSFDQGPLARDGSPLLTAEPSPFSLQAAYARSRSHDSGDEGGSDGDDGGADGRLTLKSAALSLAGALAVCWAARRLVDVVGTPTLYLLAVSALALAGSALGGMNRRSTFAGEFEGGGAVVSV
jgi:hypothetical protein